MSKHLRPALFLDRDGVINIDHGYVYKVEDFEFIPGVFELVRAANDTGYLVIVITNQAGIGRGYYTEHEFLSLCDWMKEKFSEQNAKIDDILFCPFHPIHGLGNYKLDAPCRKPNPGMIIEAAKRHNIDLGASILVGDKLSDIEAGCAGGVGTNLLFDQLFQVENNSSLNCMRVLSLYEVSRKLFKRPKISLEKC